jgi:hypothetical protein
VQICLQLSDTTLLALLDSGSTHNFISEATVNSMALPLQRHASIKDTVANGEHVHCLGILRQAAFSIDGEAFHKDLFVQPLADYDTLSSAPSGLPRWALFSIISALAQCPFGASFTKSASKAWRVTTSMDENLPEALLSNFARVYAEPHGLPPPCARDHSIVLTPRSQPMAIYAPTDNRQCTGMS